MKEARDYKIAYAIVKNAIAKDDPYSLIKMGSPNNEFDFEISAITQQIPKCPSSVELSEEIAKIFTSSFDDKFTSNDFAETAKEIYMNLKKEGLIE